jgi:NAD(P)-dependent dehydrogenase (short-subunit alcohol dehydrogenase family)
MTPPHQSPVALVTGASRGLGLALTRALVLRGWHVVVDARDGERLAAAVAALPDPSAVTAIAGDVVDDDHRAALAAAGRRRARPAVNNASVLGPEPLPPLARHPLPTCSRSSRSTPSPRSRSCSSSCPPAGPRGCVVGVSSDAAVEAYAGWGAYGAAKAALDHASAVLAVEHPELRVHAFDPGDMDTELHRLATRVRTCPPCPPPTAWCPRCSACSTTTSRAAATAPPTSPAVGAA